MIEYCKLQIGCMIVLLYIIFIYYRERKKYHIEQKNVFYELLFIVGFFCLLLDGITVYTVNHLESVDQTLNLVLHGMFLSAIDALVFILFLYILSVTNRFPKEKKQRVFIYLPFVINIIVVVYSLPSLEYRAGKYSNYSMGLSAYTCYAMVGIYVLATLVILLRQWQNLLDSKRVGIFTCLVVSAVVCIYQMIVPDALISSIGVLLMILGAYVNQEDPAMQELTRYHKEMVTGFATLIENRDDNTGGHVKRTTQYVKILAEELRNRGYYRDVLTKDYMNNLLLSAPMHDIGKIAVPDMILQKPGKLTSEEFEIMKQHAEKGGEIIKKSFSRMGNTSYMEMAYQIARHHHEKWNGKGYPDGLKRKEIPLCARIMAIADVFDAVSEKRCYRDALPLEECFEIIMKGSGQDFDPLLVEVFMDMRNDVEAIRKK